MHQWARLVMAGFSALVVASSCSPLPAVTPGPTILSRSPAVSVSPSSSPSYADTIRIGLLADSGPLGPLSNATSAVGDDFQKAAVVDRMIYAGLYRYDAQVRPVPDLATSCQPDSIGTTVTCELADAKFQNGDPVTADDVVFTYDVMAAHTEIASDFSRSCVSQPGTGSTGCLFEVLGLTTSTDARHVAFHLRFAYSPFMTLVLPGLWIDSRKVVDADYEAFRAKAAPIGQKALQATADKLQAPAESESAADCAPLLLDAAQLVSRAGLLLPDRAEFNLLQDASFDACAYAGALSLELAQAAASLRSQGAAAVADVYPALPFNRHPVGTGPYRLSSYEPGKQLLLQADPSYHGVRALTPHMLFTFFADAHSAAAAAIAGQVDWVEVFFDQPRELRLAQNLHVGTPPNPSIKVLAYNSRPGRLFSDANLRRAIELCAEKGASDRAATGGSGAPVVTDIVSGWWGFDPSLKDPLRDVTAARKLIESSGWSQGADGIYEKNGRGLRANVYVRTDDPERLHFVRDLVVQVRECGIDLVPVQGDFSGNLHSIVVWPNTAPGSKQPFDLYFLGENFNFDPVPRWLLSSEITTKNHREADNFMGFRDPRLDALMRQNLITYDLDQRAEIYRRYQAIVAQDQPVLFAWEEVRLTGLSKGLRMVDGPVDLTTMNWSWRPEAMIIEATQP